MDATCLNVVTDVSVGNGVETLTSRSVIWFWYMATLKVMQQQVFINYLIHHLFSPSIWVLVSVMAPSHPIFIPVPSL